MEKRVLGLVIVFAFTLVQAFGQTRNDLDRKLNDAKNHLNVDIPKTTLHVHTQIAEEFLKQAGSSSLATQCIYTKSKWYLNKYYDPLMRGFIHYESFRINDIEDQLKEADFTNQTAINQLHEDISAAVVMFDKEMAIWREFVSPTRDILANTLKSCLSRNGV
ncbi:hypothetical protein GE061_012080 [Apolygus lucorum]|uniref:Uncharacterized protein n=1 Tax=Apolygus lucorum TaxID=248454 RepID=A0A6A4JUB6_APOLU|nr:hypothetical protein GE061_012080 [Apolygus lucorum]